MIVKFSDTEVTGILISADLPKEHLDKLVEILEVERRKKLAEAHQVPHDREGYNDLWAWFNLSYASWLVLPKVLMHAMPDAWQKRMAELLYEWDEHWDLPLDTPDPVVSARRGNKFCKWPTWLTYYKHPNLDEIEKVKAK